MKNECHNVFFHCVNSTQPHRQKSPTLSMSHHAFYSFATASWLLGGLMFGASRRTVGVPPSSGVGQTSPPQSAFAPGSSSAIARIFGFEKCRG